METMNDTHIAQLANILRDNGDKILSSSSKFTLSTTLLHNLNKAFALIHEQRDNMSASFHVINTTTTHRSDFFRDLQFLYDFLQRTVSLKLTPAEPPPEGGDPLDLSILKNLKYFELHKVNAKSVRGLKNIRTQLQILVCARSIAALADIIVKCGGDEMPGFIWCELKEAAFSHNNLTVIDGSFEYTPWLHTLDLSHNEIRDATPLSCLSNLKNLNLGFNQLVSVPMFLGQLCNRLQVLILRNNFIESIRDVVALTNLCELDLTENCLLEHESLAPIAHLAALQCLTLEGNPLSFHPQHRRKTAKFLHTNTATVRFLLDRNLLAKSESRLVGSLHLVQHVTQAQFPSLCSAGSDSTLVLERPRRVRNAEIADNDDRGDLEKSFTSVASLVTSNDHLETKRKIEQLREKFGDSWMQSQGASLLQETLGLERTPVPLLSSSPYGKEFMLHANDVQYTPKEPERDMTSEQSNVTFTTAEEDLGASEESLYGGERVETPETSSDDEDLGDGEENLYLTSIVGVTEPVFVVITDTHIWERECTSGKEKCRWPLESLLSCELLGDNCTRVRLEFDTMRRDKKQREYDLEAEEATRLSSVLKNILVNRPLKDSKLIIYRCMKCSTQFSKEKQIHERESMNTVCPVCESTMVIEDDEYSKM